MSLQSELESRNLPELLRCRDGSYVTDEAGWSKRREEIMELLCREFGGFGPAFRVETEGILQREEEAFGGKAVRQRYIVNFHTVFNAFAFPFTLIVPCGKGPHPVFVYLGFGSEAADGIGEEIIDNGFAIAHINYQDIAPDKPDDFQNGLGTFCRRNPFDGWGKLGMWAYGASRVVDFLMTREDIDADRIAVMGHSRLGKAALWCGALDQRFSLIVSNDSGGGGAAIFRGKTGEHLVNLKGEGSRIWFCGNLFAYADREEEMPFDQHFLLAMAAPRHLYVASAALDSWADPHSELLGCVAASAAYRVCGKSGLICPDEVQPGVGYHEGCIGYHVRKGTHFLSREDWQQVFAYRRRHHI